MRFNEAKKEETQEVKFNAEELVDKDAEPGFTSNVEDQEKVEKASEAYDLFYNTEGFDPHQYFINQTL